MSSLAPSTQCFSERAPVFSLAHLNDSPDPLSLYGTIRKDSAQVDFEKIDFFCIAQHPPHGPIELDEIFDPSSFA